MNSKYHCNACDRAFATSALLRSHRQSMRNQGKTKGHEIIVGESVAGSTKDSQVDPKEKKKTDDFDGIDLPMDKFAKQLEASGNDMGFEPLEENMIEELEFKAPVNRAV